MSNNPYQVYKNNAILTASPEELTLMLYDGAIKFCNQAIMAIENNKTEDAHNLIIRVQDIIQEFIITLKTEFEVSKNFSVMYDYIYRRLIEANLKKDVDILKEVLKYLKELRDTWKEVIRLSKGNSK